MSERRRRLELGKLGTSEPMKEEVEVEVEVAGRTREVEELLRRLGCSWRSLREEWEG